MQAPKTERRKPISLALLFLISFAFYAAYFAEGQNNPILGAPLIDAGTYDRWATDMLRGHFLWDRVGNYLPIYPGFLAILKIFQNDAISLHFLVQGLLGALASVLVARIVIAVWGDRRAGWIAGLLHATNWMFVIHYAELYAESFSIFFLYVTVFLLVVRRSPGAAFAAGLAFALSAGTRANLFMLAPWICVWLLFRGRSDAGSGDPAYRADAGRVTSAGSGDPAYRADVGRVTSRGAFSGQGLKAAVLFGVGMMLVLAPVLARNYTLTGKLMLRAQGTWSLYSGLAPEIGGLNPQVGVQFDNYMRMPVVEGLRQEADIEAYWAKKSRDLLRERPLDVARVLLRKAVIFLADREWSKEFDVYAHRGYSNLLVLPWPGMGLLVSLGFAGCLYCRKKREVWLLLGLLVLSIVSIAPFKVFGRYRMPCEALLIPFAGWWLAEAIRLGRLGEWKRVAVLAAPVVLVGLVAWPDWLDLKGKNAARNEHLLGQFLAMQGQDHAAESAFRASMEKWPWDADSALWLARLKVAHHKPDEAEALYLEALRREPRFPEAQAGLAEIYFHDYNMTGASVAVEACLAQYPNFVPAWQIKAWIAKYAGDAEEEIQCYARAVAEGGGSIVYFQLARRLAEMGRVDEARNLYEAVIKGDRFSTAERKWARESIDQLPAANLL